MLAMLTCCSCWNLQCCGFLLLPSINMWSHPAPKWILREFDVSRIRPRLTWVTSPWNVDMTKFDLSWEGYLVWQTGLPTLKGDPQQLNYSPFIIWVNLVPLESHFYDLISCYYFWTWVLQCQMQRLHDKVCCFLKLGLTCFFFSFMRPDSFLFVFAL